MITIDKLTERIEPDNAIVDESCTVFTVDAGLHTYYIDKKHSQKYVLSADERYIKSFTDYVSALEFLINRIADRIPMPKQSN